MDLLISLFFVLSMCVLVALGRLYRQKARMAAIAKRTEEGSVANPTSLTSPFASLKAGYKSLPDVIEITSLGKDKTILTVKQQYLVKSFFVQYFRRKNKGTPQGIPLTFTNHVAETFIVYVNNQQEVADALNVAFGTKKSLSTYKRMCNKAP